MEGQGLRMDIVEKVSSALPRGVFLTTSGEKDNTMIIGWGSSGVMWGQPVFMVPVRLSRFTHKQLSLNGYFTLTAPAEGMEKAVGICGTQSGKDIDKFAVCNLTKQAGKLVDVPVIAGGLYHLECQVLCQTEMKGEFLSEEIAKRWYAGEDEGNLHSLYYAKILGAYEG